MKVRVGRVLIVWIQMLPGIQWQVPARTERAFKQDWCAVGNAKQQQQPKAQRNIVHAGLLPCVM